MSGWCLEGIHGISKWYVMCQDLSDGQVRTNRVLELSQGSLLGVSKVSGGHLWDVRMVSEMSFDNIKLVVKVIKQLSFCSIITSENYEGGFNAYTDNVDPWIRYYVS